jgi:tetratricopeptide (TPR) repeat protein
MTVAAFRPSLRLRSWLALALPLASWSVQADTAPAAAADRTPANPEAGGLLRLGTSLTGHGDYETAEIAYRQILERPEFSIEDQKTALLGLAHMFRKAGASTKSVAIYEKFLKEFPDDARVPDAFLDLGRTLRDMGAYNLALTRFYSVINTTLKLPSGGFDHYSQLAKTAEFEIAQTYYEEGDFAAAGKFFLRVRLLDLSPEDRGRALFMAGCAQQRAGDLDGAVTSLRAFLKQSPKDENVPEARYVLATALDGLKRPQEALAVTLALLNVEHGRIATDPRRWTYWQRRTGNQLANRFFQSGDPLNALAIYDCLATLSSEPAWRMPVLYQTALCYERLFQTDRALAAYQAVIDAATAKGVAATPELAELVDMARWRQTHLQWRDATSHKLTNVFSSGSVPPGPAPAPPAS